MLIGFTAIIVAVYLCGMLLFRLSVHVFPLLMALLIASAAYRAGHGIFVILAAAILAAIATIAIAQIALGLVKSDIGRAAIGLVFALPAAFASYHIMHGIAAATMPNSVWQICLSLISALAIGKASWMQWSRAAS
jgi:hypothetical protein